MASPIHLSGVISTREVQASAYFVGLLKLGEDMTIRVKVSP